LFVLETNTQPGMTPLSLVPEQAAGCGISYADLVEMLVAEALRVHALRKKGGGDGAADPA
jgi:D-alanine-D-alanine ligase